MAFSEIDDIFAGKVSKQSEGTSLKSTGKPKAANDSPSTASTQNAKKKTKKRKRRDPNDEPATINAEAESERNAVAGDVGANEGAEASTKPKVKRTRPVETVQDPSAILLKTAKARSEKEKEKTKEKTDRTDLKPKEKRKEEGDDLERFRDSRGSGPRKRTEEGFLVYKEDELGIRDEGGDTPLCPFDCNCCF